MKERVLSTDNARSIVLMLSAKGYEDLSVTDTFRKAFLEDIENTLMRPFSGYVHCLGPGLKVEVSAQLTFDEWVLLRLKYF